MINLPELSLEKQQIVDKLQALINEISDDHPFIAGSLYAIIGSIQTKIEFQMSAVLTEWVLSNTPEHLRPDIFKNSGNA